MAIKEVSKGGTEPRLRIFVLLRGSASMEREMRCWELANVSMQVVATTVWLRVLAE